MFTLVSHSYKKEKLQAIKKELGVVQAQRDVERRQLEEQESRNSIAQVEIFI